MYTKARMSKNKTQNKTPLVAGAAGQAEKAKRLHVPTKPKPNQTRPRESTALFWITTPTRHTTIVPRGFKLKEANANYQVVIVIVIVIAVVVVVVYLLPPTQDKGTPPPNKPPSPQLGGPL